MMRWGNMTAIAIWYEPADRRVWAVGDTRVVGAYDRPLTDGASKLLPLSVACRQPGRDGFYTDLTFQTSWGFAYAGSTLYALMSYAVANACLANLIHAAGAAPPSIAQAATMFQRIGRVYLQDIHEGGGFEAAIFGWCPARRQFVGYKLSDNCNTRTEIALQTPRDLIQLGGRQEEIRTAVNAMLEANECAPIIRVPKVVISQMIRGDVDPRIGGAVQVGRATQEGFDLVGTVEVYEGRGPEAYMSLLGFNVQDVIGSVGHCQVGIRSTF